MKTDNKQVIKNLQDDSDYILLNNPLASPKFIREIGKEKYSPIEKDTYTPKVFYEIASRLSSDLLENLKRNENIVFELNIKQFLTEIGANAKNFNYLIKTVKSMQSVLLAWKEGEKGKKRTITVPIVSKSIHHENTGIIELFVDIDLARHILQVSEKENFSFLKSNLFTLQNAQAIKLYPFFESWANYNKPYTISLEEFRIRFGYDSSGYSKYSNLEFRVLKPATQEINEKTNINVSYKPIGENIGGTRPRVEGLIFYITAKEKTKELPVGNQAQEEPIQSESLHTSNVIPLVTPLKKEEFPTMEGTPSRTQIVELAEKAKLTMAQTQVIQDMCGDNTRTWEVINGYLKAPNKEKIGNPFAYMIDDKSIKTLGIGFWEAEKDKARQKEAERIEKEKQALLQRIQTEYEDRKKKQFLTFYEKTSDQEKTQWLEHIRETETLQLTPGVNRNRYIDGNGLNESGKMFTGSRIAEQRGAGRALRQSKFRNEIFERYEYQIDYDHNDRVIYSTMENLQHQFNEPF